MKKARVRLVVGVLMGVCFWLGWTSASWGDDDDEGGGGGGGGGGEEPAPADHDDGKADTPDPADSHDDDKPAAAADDDKPEPAPGAADSDHDGTPDSEEQPAAAGTADSDHDGTPDSEEHPAAAGADSDHDGTPDADEPAVASADEEGEPPYVEYDLDGDGVVEPGEAAFEKEYEAAFAGVPDEITDDALDARDPENELVFSMTAEQFRKLVRLAKAKVLPRLEAKIDRKQAVRMKNFTLIVCGFSLFGVLLLLMPLALRKKYPGQGKLLFKYSALASGTWIVTVLLFGAVLFGMRTAQGAMSGLTNPQLAIAGGLFDTLDRNAEEYLYTSKELFAPTLEQLQGNEGEQPAVALLANGVKIVQDAKVFLSMAKLVKHVDWAFAMLPIVLLIVTLVLLALALKPTLIEIIKVPTRAASGEAGVGQDVMKRSMRRVAGEMKATAATVGVLVVLTLVSAFVLGKIVGPALDGLLRYFSMSVNYLQFVEGASSGKVFLALFGVIFFLVLNLATLILSMAFFLGKTQKIFQQRFNQRTPLAVHRKFFKWGIPSILFVQVFPLLFALVAEQALRAINHKLVDGVKDAADVNWTALLLVGPLFLVLAYIVAFWAARGVKAIRFIQSYKVKAFDKPIVAESVPSQEDRSGEISKAA